MTCDDLTGLTKCSNFWWFALIFYVLGNLVALYPRPSAECTRRMDRLLGIGGAIYRVIKHRHDCTMTDQ